MARMRSIKPEYWHDRKMARVSRDARLLYIALWNQADEWGRCHGDIRLIKGSCFPYDDDLDNEAIDRLLSYLSNLGRVQRYSYDDDPYLYLPKLAKHQRLEPHKTPSRLPPPPDPENFPDQSEIFPESVTERSQQADPTESSQVNGASHVFPEQSEKIPERSGRNVVQHVAGSREHVAGSMLQEAGGTTADKPAPRSERAHRIPDDFTVSDSMRSWAAKETPNVNIGLATDKFIDYWRGRSGAIASKLDWPATWRNWMRDEREKTPAGTKNGRGGTEQFRMLG